MITDKDLIIGHCYSAKKPKLIGFFPRLYNDRQIVWLGIDQVQYDSPTVKMGRKLPIVTIEKFLKWADKDITDTIPKGAWREC